MRNSIDYFKILLKYAPKQAAIIAALNLIDGLCPIVIVVYTTRFIDLALDAASTGAINGQIYVSVAALILFTGYTLIMPVLQKMASEKAKLNLKQGFGVVLIEKCAKLEYRYIEDAESWDLISRVLDKSEETIVNNYTAINQVFATGISVAGVLSIIATQVWWASVIIILCCVPLFYLSIKSGKANYKAKVDSAEQDRRCEYISEILTGRDHIDERSLFGYTQKINEEYSETFRASFRIKTITRFRWFVKTSFGGIFTAIASLVVILVLLKPVMSGIISPGLFISLVNAILSLTGSLSWGLSYKIDTIVSGLEYIKDIRQLMAYEEREEALAKPAAQRDLINIEFKNVSFTYPGTELQILRNVSFILEKGKHYAFVGANGAGKTTIIKLLTGLYTNYEGEIFINNRELRNYSYGELKGFFSAVYQDFAKHEFTFGENITIGDLEAVSGYEEKVVSAIRLTGLEEALLNLPKGLETNLGKIHSDGIDLSEGQWQRLAMARAIFSPAPVRILDEPTAALDPLSENKMYNLFGSISRSAMTIFISHRMASTKIADEILVFNEGILVERGDFDALMKQQGLYHEMFEQQRSWYQ